MIKEENRKKEPCYQTCKSPFLGQSEGTNCLGPNKSS